MNTSDGPPSFPPQPDALAEGGYILVVDDDPSMLGMIETVLGSQGWTVKTATGAHAAFAILDSSPQPPVVLLCDVMMKGVDGFHLTRKLLARVPGLKAIIMSAHLADFSWWPQDLRDWPFLSKPFSNEALLGAVRDSLAR